MIRQSTALCGASAAALLLAAGSAQAQQTTTPSATDRGRDAQATTNTVQELIVTAQKREESINDVPMSVTAASGETLTELGIQDTSQLVKIVPGFNYTPSY